MNVLRMLVWLSSHTCTHCPCTVYAYNERRGLPMRAMSVSRRPPPFIIPPNVYMSKIDRGNSDKLILIEHKIYDANSLFRIVSN